MNRAQRRRQANKERGLAVFCREMREGGFGSTGGAMETMVVRGPLLLSAKYFGLMMNFGAEVSRADAGHGPLCLTCDHEICRSGRGPAALVVTIPIHGAASQAIVSGICQVCAWRSDEELCDRVYQNVKKAGLAASVIGHTGREN